MTLPRGLGRQVNFRVTVLLRVMVLFGLAFSTYLMDLNSILLRRTAEGSGFYLGPILVGFLLGIVGLYPHLWIIARFGLDEAVVSGDSAHPNFSLWNTGEHSRSCVDSPFLNSPVSLNSAIGTAGGVLKIGRICGRFNSKSYYNITCTWSFRNLWSIC